MLLDRLFPRRGPDYYYTAAEACELPNPTELTSRLVANKAVGHVVAIQNFGPVSLEERWPNPKPAKRSKRAS